MTADSSSPRKLIPISQPISLLPTPEANVYSHIHPVLLLSLYYLRFPSLVASPVPTLLSDLVPLSILQITYTVLCLPPTASGSKSAGTPSKKPKSKRGSAAKGNGGIATKIVVSKLFTIYHEKLTQPRHDQTVFPPFSGPYNHPRRTAPDRHPDLIRRPANYPPTTYGALCYAHCVTICFTSVLRIWS